MAEHVKKIIDRAKAIVAEHNISFMEALEVIKIVDSSLDKNLEEITAAISCFDNNLKDISSDLNRNLKDISSDLNNNLKEYFT